MEASNGYKTLPMRMTGIVKDSSLPQSLALAVTSPFIDLLPFNLRC